MFNIEAIYISSVGDNCILPQSRTDMPTGVGAHLLLMQNDTTVGILDTCPTLRRFALDQQTRTELEAAAFRGLVEHLRRRTDVQNIDLMNLAGFCRNCLSKWYMAAAKKRGVDMNYDRAREAVYGMPYENWKAKFQTEATPAQQQKYEDTKPLHAEISAH
jgi:uncharacterized protein